MYKHNIKIAFRNMLKYKYQTLISMIGLTVGLTCFVLSMLWIRYEMTFDSFHENAKQMYVVYFKSSNQIGYQRSGPSALAAHLKEIFPEIANSALVSPTTIDFTITVDDVESKARFISVDSAFLKMFDVKIIAGNRNFWNYPGDRFGGEVAITQDKARQLFGNESPLGKTFKLGETELTITAVVSGMLKQSNYPYDIIRGLMLPNPDVMWFRTGGENTVIELHRGTDVEAFEKKLYEHSTQSRPNWTEMTVKPLTKMRYTDMTIDVEVRYQYILIFALSGLLVVLCSLFNYLTLYVSRFRIRLKELALRMVCGASGRSLLTMLSVEFILTLIFAVVLGCMLTQLVYKPFISMSNIQLNLSAIYREAFIYVGGVILISLAAFWLILLIFKHGSLNLSIRQNNKKMLRKASVVVQLVISTGFVFCIAVILKQMYFLHNTADLGFSFKNRASIMAWGDNRDVLADRLMQIPEITEVYNAMGLQNLLPQSGRATREIKSWDDKPAGVEDITIELQRVSPRYTSFYDFRLVAGEMLTDADPQSMVLLNETAAKAFGWHDPVGKQFDGSSFPFIELSTVTVKGVIRHVHNFAPTVQANPVCYFKGSPDAIMSTKWLAYGTAVSGGVILFKYHEGTWETCTKKIEQLATEFDISRIYNAEEEYNNYLKSEKNLMLLLSFVSVICVLICVFGFVSLISLTCEERRKSIAIRKVNGATASDILAMFAKEYFLLLFIGVAIAFSAGHLIMQRWLENYAFRTNIPAWLYLSIVCMLALVIVVCVGWQVYKSSVENPAEVVKSE